MLESPSRWAGACKVVCRMSVSASRLLGSIFRMRRCVQSSEAHNVRWCQCCAFALTNRSLTTMVQGPEPGRRTFLCKQNANGAVVSLSVSVPLFRWSKPFSVLIWDTLLTKLTDLCFVPLYMTCLHVIVYTLLAWSPCLLISAQIA